MFKSLESDREYLEQKYHKQDGTFEEQYVKSAHLNTQYGRMAFHGYEYDPTTGLTDEEISGHLKEMIPQLDQLPRPVAKATAIRYVLENTRIDVNEHDYFIGIYSWNRLSREVTVSRWDNELFEKTIPEIKEEIEELNDAGAHIFWPDYDHVVVDWLAIMDLGFPGLLERARKYRAEFEASGKLTEEKAAFFEAIDIEYSAIIAFVDRLYQYALTRNFQKAPRIAECLKHLRDGAPQDTYEALQIMYIFFMIMESVDCYQCRSLGNGLDRTLQKFYDADTASGKYTKEEIGEFIGYFLIQFSAIGNYWGQPFYLGGTDENGNCRITELSYLIIDVYRELKIYNPKVQIKLSRNIPREFLNRVFDMIRNGQNSFVFCSEENHIKLLMAAGVSYEEARDFDVVGCYEGKVRGDHVTTSAGNLNVAKACLYALYNGVDTAVHKKIGISTGERDTLTTFKDFYHAVVLQLAALTERAISINNAVDPYLGIVNPSSMYSGTVKRSLERGLDGYQAGVRYNDSSITPTGMATLIDSVLAVKYLVYEKKVCSLEELCNALEANWVGYEKLRLLAINCPWKYGNGDPVADRYTEALSRQFTMRVVNRPNGKGGVLKAEAHSPRYVWLGLKTQATPDGRYAGEEISKNASPTPGMDRNGATALIRSAIALHPENYTEGGCLDLMLHPSAVSGEEGLDVLYSLIMSYMDNGGSSVHINVFDVEMLKDAQVHPEKYRNLQVRVCGWNVLWNNLTKPEQDAYILRARNVKD